ncbi:MAG: hypothetical protein EPO51_10615 [Phenylobacterium sp.]|uniref:hypothetical protein n=1 Tax=Phenylobacterium sp. TaxID=1871053 RepID=UPI0011F48737|nr:hypothetical protein [Phenylobacterium sp.]TAJ72537.1 MAG: hypothetical protein EPO51_10615 [Phenylobacterium sp.]
MSTSVSPRTILLAAGLCLALAGPAAAQSGFLKNLARQAAAAAIQNAATPPTPAAAAGGEAQEEAAQPTQDAQTDQAAATSGPAPWPTNAGARTVRYPSDLDFSPELEAGKKAFVEFSKVRCSDCEGGYSYDAWAQQMVRLDGSYKAWEKKLGGMALGETLSWKGAQSKGLITVMSEEPVNGWPCKQLKWELDKPGAHAERPGLICYAKESSYSGSDSWNIAF